MSVISILPSWKRADVFVLKAIEMEQKQNYKVALGLYVAAVDYYLHGIIYEAEDEESKNTWREKRMQYLERIDQLKEILEEKDTADATQEIEENIQETLTPGLAESFKRLTQATEEDRKRNYEEALKLYDQGLECLLNAIIHEAREESTKELIRLKRKTYLERAEKLREFLKKGHETPERPENIKNLRTLTQSIELVTQAVEQDRNREFEKALRSYEEGVESFLHSIVYEASGEKAKEAIRVKRMQYIGRAEKIKEYLKKRDNNSNNNEKPGTKYDFSCGRIFYRTTTKPALQKAIESESQAIKEDQKGNYKKALRLYGRGLEYSLHAIIFEAESEEAKETIRTRRLQNIERVEKLKEILKNKQMEHEKRNGLGRCAIL